jgi:anti-sigma B factor antagonist
MAAIRREILCSPGIPSPTWMQSCDMLAATQEMPNLMILDAEIERVNPTTAVVRLAGRMTLGTRLREVESRISDLVDHGVQKIIVDLSGIEFADSAGLGLIMFLYGKMKTAGGELRLVTPGPRLLELFTLTRTDSILTIDPDLATALAV